MLKRRITILLCLSILLTACSTTTAQVRADNRENLLNLSIGMSKEKVLDIMGKDVDKTKDGHIITNPYRTEMYQVNGNIFELLLYYTDLKKNDGAITDDELTPIVIKNGKVDGWGWSYWDDIVKKYEVRIR